MPPKSSRIRGRINWIEVCATSRRTARKSTAARALAKLAFVGSRFLRRALRHSLVKGPTVTSKAPPLWRLTDCANRRTSNSSELTGTNRSEGAVRLKRFNSLCER